MDNHSFEDLWESTKKVGQGEPITEIQRPRFGEEEPEGDVVLDDEDSREIPEPPEEVADGASDDPLDMTKEFIGQNEDTYFYLITTDEEGGEQDLVITDQEGVKVMSASEMELEVNNESIPDFLIQAFQGDTITQIEASVFTKYILPKLLEEDEEENEPIMEPDENQEDEEGIDDDPAGDEFGEERPRESMVPTVAVLLREDKDLDYKDIDPKTLAAHCYATYPDGFPDMDAGTMESIEWDKLATALNEIAVDETEDAEEDKDDGPKKIYEMEMADKDGNKLNVELSDDGTLDTVININGREFRFTSEFVQNWREVDGELTEEGLQELALDALSSLQAEEYHEVISGVAATDPAERVESEMQKPKIQDPEPEAHPEADPERRERPVESVSEEVVEESALDEKEAPMCSKCNSKHWPFKSCGASDEPKKDDDKKDEKDESKEDECKDGKDKEACDESETTAKEFVAKQKKIDAKGKDVKGPSESISERKSMGRLGMLLE